MSLLLLDDVQPHLLQPDRYITANSEQNWLENNLYNTSQT